ncbi:LysR family transcriptional regulator [Photobacterium sagamiensis]|uniref:LysR family transcriptional regulator n=1 Tax=Photobacterium sagamiensis TaxID=2910241 RepID=UPI003D0FB8E0
MNEINKTDLSQLKRLAIFSAVVEQGSFAQAARVLGMSPSSISEQIALLEKGLGMRLIQRTTRNLNLTADGEKIYPEANIIATSLTNISTFAADDQLRGTVRISVSHDIALDWLNPRLESFSKLYPEISFDLRLSDLVVDLISDQIDFAIRVSPTLNESLIARSVFKENLSVFTSTKYIKDKGLPQNSEDLKNASWVLLPQLEGGKKVTLSTSGKQFSFAPKHYHICDSPHVLIDMVKRGMGLTLLLPKLTEYEMRSGNLRLIMPTFSGASFTFSLVYHSRKQLSLRVRILIDFLLGKVDK